GRLFHVQFNHIPRLRFAHGGFLFPTRGPDDAHPKAEDESRMILHYKSRRRSLPARARRGSTDSPVGAPVREPVGRRPRSAWGGETQRSSTGVSGMTGPEGGDAGGGDDRIGAFPEGDPGALSAGPPG